MTSLPFPLLFSPFLVCLFSILQTGIPDPSWKWTLTPMESPYAVQTILSNHAPTFSVPSCILILAEHCEGGGKSTGFLAGPVSTEDLVLMGHYICPSSNPERLNCNQSGHYFCAYWDCVTLASDEATYWTVNTDQFLKLKLVSNTGCTWDWFFHSPASKQARCTQLNLTVQRPKDDGWLLGRTWGVRRYESGYDQGGFFTIRKEPVPPPVAVEPNPIVNLNSPMTDDPPHPVSLHSPLTGTGPTDPPSLTFPGPSGPDHPTTSSP
ncbi:sorting nexin-10 isoform X2 [Monodelphis domestica]|uniref:sorting nexin-10 isoform X2 n=1 Tax=Monodelphis domestica TaxID=13616 RepID=UPI0024E20DFE|nr:sorting nexin-10 isoform X2 [Monodelphis domestica]XP_056656427.1 sorting nexin-10 isoform X2 [Monodelphis domestica]XP_056656432.1 sorting nexin-10 isoform X2 [Monodelphis domestica]